MDNRSNCIIIFDKNIRRYVDKVSDITNIKIDDINKKTYITYKNGKEYTYNSSSVKWLTNPIVVDPTDKLIYSHNRKLNNVKEILIFDDEWVKILFRNNELCSYNKVDIKIVRNRKNDIDVKNLLEYLKAISSTIDENLNEKKGFIQSELERIEVSDESILSKFIANKGIESEKRQGLLIFPFSANGSQIQAVKNALTYNISTIQGPPGTGKTQTILNLIANLLIRDKKIAVVSGNNEATRNVQEKLEKVGLGEICAFLGNSKNVNLFFEQEHTDPIIETENRSNINENTIISLSQKVKKFYEYRKHRAQINGIISEFEIEKIKNDDVFGSRQHNIPQSLKNLRRTSKEYLETSAFLDVLSSKKRISILDKIRMRFKFSLRKCKLILNSITDCIDYLQNQYYKSKLNELKYEQRKLQNFLNNVDNVNVLNDFEQTSMIWLKRHMSQYFENIENKSFSKATYRRYFDEFKKRYPIIFSTTHSLRACSGGNLYDYVIVDESSQVDLASAVIAMSCAKHIVFVGDLKQLPHIVKGKDRKAVEDVYRDFSLPKYYEYSKNSILQCISNKYGQKMPNVLLNEHYRCDPQIIEFCNKQFYGGKLIIQTAHKENCGLKILKTESHTAIGRINYAQIESITKEVLPCVKDESIGIVAPYCDQVNKITQTIDNANILVDTVHKFQGKERNVMIMSTVSDRVVFYEDDEKCDFLNNDQLINVALSRAVINLYVIASEEMIEQEGTLINELARYATYYCDSDAIKSSQLYSIFQLMYDEYSPILEQLRRRIIKVSKYESENVIYTLLKDICDGGEFGNIKFEFNYPLRNMINEKYLTNIEDINFVKCENTHCDFVIYNKIDKSVRLVLEIDGKQHDYEPQKSRDARKDRLLKYNNIPFLRLRTTDVDCENKIRSALSKK